MGHLKMWSFSFAWPLSFKGSGGVYLRLFLVNDGTLSLIYWTI
jgi:hypothetical protein